MGAHDADHPSKRGGKSIYPGDELWLWLRQHALGEGVTASAIVTQLISQYRELPPALRVPTLRAVRDTREDGEG